jgi:hypothetical protein
MQFGMLVFPAPLGPMSARIVPGATSKLTSLRAASPPKASRRSSMANRQRPQRQRTGVPSSKRSSGASAKSSAG